MYQEGDTIVEVVIAFAMFSLIAVVSIATMNRGLAVAQNNLEVGLVRQQIDAQADLLSFVRNSERPSDKLVWDQISSTAQSMSTGGIISSDTLLNGGCPSSMPSSGFALGVNSSGAVEMISNFEPAALYSGVAKDEVSGINKAYGIWVQPARAEGVSGAYDMHIKACWANGVSKRPSILVTIVRLYES